MARQVLTEATDTTRASAVEGTPGRFLVQLIDVGWGSSGYYSADVLEAAAKNGIFRKGTHQYIDHPTASEQYERPERSLRDLAAVLAEDARFDPDLQSLVAEAQVFGPYRPVLDEMKDSIGVSIRAAAEVTEGGEADGRRGRIIDALVEGLSADYVTHAGRGGKILQVLESARGISEATANDTREQLEQALRDSYGGEKSWLGVRDFDESTVWFWWSTPDSEGCYQLGYTTDDAGVLSLSGDPVEVRPRTTYVPVSPAPTAAQERKFTAKQRKKMADDGTAMSDGSFPIATKADLRNAIQALGRASDPDAAKKHIIKRARALGAISELPDDWGVTESSDPTNVPVSPAGQSTTQESKEDTMATTQIEESELARLREDAGRVTTLESERDTARQERDTAQAERDEAREALAARERGDVVARIVGEAAEAAGYELNQFETAGIASQAVVGEDGAVDEAATRTAFDTAIASLAESAGAGRPRGLGGKVTTSGDEAVSEADLDAIDDATFGEIKEA